MNTRKYWMYVIISDLFSLISSSYDLIVGTNIPKRSNFLDRISTEYLIRTLNVIDDREDKNDK